MDISPNWDGFSPGIISVIIEYDDDDISKIDLDSLGEIIVEKDDIEVNKTIFIPFEDKTIFNFSGLCQKELYKVKLKIGNSIKKEILVPCLNYTYNKNSEINRMAHNNEKILHKGIETTKQVAPKMMMKKKQIARNLLEDGSTNNGYGGSFSLAYKPPVTTQNVYYNGRYAGETGSCVANACGSMLNIFQTREGKAEYNEISIGYIWGGCGYSESAGTYWDDMLDFMLNEGSPPVEAVPRKHMSPPYPDIYLLDDSNGYTGARTLYNHYYEQASKYAVTQKVDYMHGLECNPLLISPVDAKRVQDVIRHEKKAVLVAFSIDKSFDDVGSDGIVGPLRCSYRSGHCALVTGWKTINGKNYWEIQNSWGTSWGKRGMAYIPFDWCDYVELYEDDEYWYYETHGLWYFFLAQDGTYEMPPLGDGKVYPYVLDRSYETITFGWKPKPNIKYYKFIMKKKSTNEIVRQVDVYSTYPETEYWTGSSKLEYGTRYIIELKPYLSAEFPATIEVVTAPPPPGITASTNKNNELIVTTDRGSYQGFVISGTGITRTEKDLTQEDWYFFKDTKFTDGFGTVTWTNLTKGSITRPFAYSFIDTEDERICSSNTWVPRDITIGDDKEKPQSFYWTGYPLKPETTFSITAKEWNDLLKYTRELQEYLNETPTIIEDVNPGSIVTAADYNTLIKILARASSTGYVTVTKDVTQIKALHFNNLVEKYNKALDIN